MKCVTTKAWKFNQMGLNMYPQHAAAWTFQKKSVSYSQKIIRVWAFCSSYLTSIFSIKWNKWALTGLQTNTKRISSGLVERKISGRLLDLEFSELDLDWELRTFVCELWIANLDCGLEYRMDCILWTAEFRLLILKFKTVPSKFKIQIQFKFKIVSSADTT